MALNRVYASPQNMATATQGSCAYARSCKLPVGNGASTQRHEFYLTLSETYKIAEVDMIPLGKYLYCC